MKITSLRRLPRAERVRIYVDDEDRPRAEIALDLTLRAGLAKGDELTDARLAALTAEDEVYRGREAALSLLSHRARTRVELSRRLRRKEFGPEIVERVLEWLGERGYLDDRAFAEAFVRDRLRLRPRGRMALLRELRGKGVDDATATAAVDAVMEARDVDEAALAQDAARAWARRNRSALRRAASSPDERQRVRRRLYGHLARRGFVGDAVRSAVAAVLDD